MRPRRHLAVATVLALAVTATAAASTADKKITPRGVGKVKLGAHRGRAAGRGPDRRPHAGLRARVPARALR